MNQLAFHNQIMNIVELVSLDDIFICTSCNWFGKATDLAFYERFSCCPNCHDYDVRVQNEIN